MSEQRELSTDATQHALQMALARASAIISSLSMAYDMQRERFALSDQFVVQAVAAVENFLDEARGLASGVSAHGFAESPDTVLPSLAKLSAVTPVEAPAASGAPVPVVARSYDELIRKITAAEVFAAEAQGNAIAGNGPLLPLLRSLREELHRMKAA
jgi:hypothetical protein